MKTEIKVNMEQFVESIKEKLEQQGRFEGGADLNVCTYILGHSRQGSVLFGSHIDIPSPAPYNGAVDVFLLAFRPEPSQVLQPLEAVLFYPCAVRQAVQQAVELLNLFVPTVPAYSIRRFVGTLNLLDLL